jgi:GTPase SAR1 family protein
MKKLFQKLTLQISKTSSSTQGLNKSFLLNFTQRKNFAFLFPSKTIKIPDEIRESGESHAQSDPKKSSRKENREKIRMQNYESKFRLDPYDLDDYIIIGKEVFKNKFKEALIKKEKNEITEEEFDKMLAEDESHYYDKSYLIYKEHGNSKQVYRRPFNSGSNIDQMHMFAIPRNDKIEPYTALGMYNFSKPENSAEKLRELIYLRNNYISSFSPPFELGNGELDDIYKSFQNLKEKYNLDLNSEEKIHKIVNDEYAETPLQSAFIKDKRKTAYLKEYLDIQDRILEEIQTNLSFKTIPNLLLKFVYELGFNDKHFWTIIEQIVLDNLHHYNVNELSKIFYVATFACPKFTTEVFRSIIYEEVYKQLENCGADDLIHVMFGFREIKNKKIFDKIANIIIAKKDKLVKNKLEDISRLLYSYASHKPKSYGINTLNPQRELVEKVVKAYEEDLVENLMKMNVNEMARVATMLYLLRIEHVDIFTK